MKNDDWIIRKLLKRKESGLNGLIDHYGGLLKSVVQKYLYALPDRQDECLNDIFLSIWNHIGQYDSNQSSFKNWICSIARYRAINFLKKYQKDLNLLDMENHSTQLPVHEDTPFAEELWELKLEELLFPLKEKDRQLFRDIFNSTYSTTEIAEKHNLSEGALYSRVSRGKVAIRNFFRSEEK